MRGGGTHDDRTGLRARDVEAKQGTPRVGSWGYDTHVRLADVQRIALRPGVLTQTRDVLRKFGVQGCEGLVLWVGTIDGPHAAVRGVLVPEQNPIREESGVGYFVEGPVLFKISKYLEKEKLRLIAQVHSHPTDAYHSETDDRYAIVTEDGGFSLVVPDFAHAPMELHGCAIYRLHAGEWLELDEQQIDAAFSVT